MQEPRPQDEDTVSEPGTSTPEPTSEPTSEPAAGPASGRRAQRSRGDGSAASFLRELPVLLLVAFVLAFLLRTFVVQVFYIPSQSMEPTLQVNDRMVVEKITYRFRPPQRGEIVVFEGESTPLPDQEAGERVLRGIGQFLGIVPANARDFVKRVIGLPGDTIRIEDGRVFVNDVPIEEPYVRFEDSKTQGPYEVPEGKLFFLGDNRPNSSDSRYTLGYVDMDAVVGRAAAIIWPLEHVEGLGGASYPALEDGAPEDGGAATGRDVEARAS